MSTVVVPKTEYKKLLQTQKELLNRIEKLEKVIGQELNVKPSVLRRWERQSRLIDQGKGRVFRSTKEFRRYLKDL